MIDRSTDEAMQRIAASGLLRLETRARRSLSSQENDASNHPLSEEERRRALEHRDQARRKLKMGRLLAGGELIEEAYGPLLDSVLALARAFAVEARQPEPATVSDALLPPASFCWDGALSVLREFASNPAAPWQPTVEILENRLR